MIVVSRAGQPGARERDDFSSKRHLALAPYLSMIFSENRCPLFGIMLYAALVEIAAFGRNFRMISSSDFGGLSR
jgi:hypothetical protein